MKKIKPSFLPGILWIIISTILLTLPGSAFPKENWLDKIWFDKWVHLAMFALLVFLFGWALFRKIQDLQRLKKGFLIVAILSLCYGIIMEFVQESFVPNRSFDQWDIVADFVGCFIGCWRINKLSDRIKNKPL